MDNLQTNWNKKFLVILPFIYNKYIIINNNK
jgi:hypothetical protein